MTTRARQDLADTALNVNGRCQKSTSAEIFNHILKWGLRSPYHVKKILKAAWCGENRSAFVTEHTGYTSQATVWSRARN